MAIDFESWERDHTLITELGVSIREWGDQDSIKTQDHHFIVSEHRSYTNSVFVKGNRDHFNFGSSRTMSLKEIISWLKETISSYMLKQPLFLIFHGGSEDIRILEQWNIPLGDLTARKSTSASQSYDVRPGQVYPFDTSELFAALCGTPNERRSLERTSQLLEIPDVKYLHNAGNDAYYTIECMLSMISGGPIDTQREARWPHTGMQKHFKPQKGDPDYKSDDEDFEVDENPSHLYPPEMIPQNTEE